MILYVLRHAIAAEREDWTGDDAQRPLVPRGIRAEPVEGGLRRALTAQARGSRPSRLPLTREWGFAHAPGDGSEGMRTNSHIAAPISSTWEPS